MTPKKSRKNSPKERVAVFQPQFQEDLAYWIETDRKTALRVMTMVKHVMRDPFRGIGKPEPLREAPSGFWSRRITQEHRLVYIVEDDKIDFAQARLHY